MPTPQWVSQSVFYQVFPDRFGRSGKVSSPGQLEAWDAPPTLYGFKGGDLYAIAERLNEIVESGANAIYLTPIFASPASHRYHTTDYFVVDPLLGGNAALRTLVDAAHARGVRVVLDGVFNHVGRGFYPFVHVLENGAKSPYLNWFIVNEKWLQTERYLNAFPSDKELQAAVGKSGLETWGYACWWNLPGLPKLNTDNPQVRQMLFAVARFWIEFGIDGWRLDVPNEIDDDDFWREFRATVKAVNPDAYIVGEIWGDARRWLKGDQFDGVMNYLLGKAILGFAAQKPFIPKLIENSGYSDLTSLDASLFAGRVMEVVSLYPREHSLAQLNILGSHDTPRLKTLLAGSVNGVQMAYSLLYFMPGAPCIYYGDEIGLEGGHDPECRAGFPPHRVESFVRTHLGVLAELRQTTSILQTGDFVCAFATRGVVILARKSQDNGLVLACCNPQSSPVMVSGEYEIPDALAAVLGSELRTLRPLLGSDRSIHLGPKHLDIGVQPERSVSWWIG